MKYIKTILICLSLLFIFSCADYKSKQVNKPEKKYYNSKGFALIYDESLFENKILKRKIDNEKIVAAHSFLRRGTNIKITNPSNSNSVEVKLISNFQYPKIFTLVISDKIASILDLNPNNPYIEVSEIKKNLKFIAKKGNMFEEEKNVADKAPVEKIEMADLSIEKKSNTKSKKPTSFVIIISDFYYLDSAKKLKSELVNKTKNQDFHIKTINNKKYRLSAGPFKNFNALKSTYISLNNLGFEELNINKE